MENKITSEKEIMKKIYQEQCAGILNTLNKHNDDNFIYTNRNPIIAYVDRTTIQEKSHPRDNFELQIRMIQLMIYGDVERH